MRLSRVCADEVQEVGVYVFLLPCIFFVQEEMVLGLLRMEFDGRAGRSVCERLCRGAEESVRSWTDMQEIRKEIHHENLPRPTRSLGYVKPYKIRSTAGLGQMA